MKKTVQLCCVILALIASSCSQDNDTDELIKNEIPTPNGSKKITICHKGKETISISVNALQAHLNHGDQIGPCGSTYIPDDNFEQALIDMGLDDKLDDFVLTENIDYITLLDVRYRNISDMTGIQDFQSLEILLCSFNEILELDLSNNVELISLSCDNNLLTSLNVSNSLNLERLNCFRNQITSLDLSPNLKLTTLSTAINQLTSLNLRNVTLTSFNARVNRSLECIQVDDVEYYETNFSGRIEFPPTQFSINCGY